MEFNCPRFLPCVLNLIAAAHVCLASEAQSQPTVLAPDDAMPLQARLDVLAAAGGGKLTLTAAPSVFHIGRFVLVHDAHDIEIDGQGATLRCLATLTNADARGDSLRFVNCRHIAIRNVHFDGNRDARGGFNSNPETLRFNSCDDVLVERCTFTHDVCDGVFAWGGYHPRTSELACRNLRITGCSFADPGRSCISMVGTCDALIENSTFEGARLTRPGAALDIEANPGDPPGINHHIRFINNRVRGCAMGVSVIQSASPHDIIISGNFFEAMVSPAPDWLSVGVFTLGTNVLITNNSFEPDPQGSAIDAEDGSSFINSNSYPKGRIVIGKGNHKLGTNFER
jgi:hypothetical protein